MKLYHIIIFISFVVAVDSFILHNSFPTTKGPGSFYLGFQTPWGWRNLEPPKTCLKHLLCKVFGRREQPTYPSTSHLFPWLRSIPAQYQCYGVPRLGAPSHMEKNGRSSHVPRHQWLACYKPKCLSFFGL